MAKITTNYYVTYVPAVDNTVIWHEIWLHDGDDKELVQMSIVGWYCGEPDDEMTKTFSQQSLVAQFFE